MSDAKVDEVTACLSIDELEAVKIIGSALDYLEELDGADEISEDEDNI